LYNLFYLKFYKRNSQKYWSCFDIYIFLINIESIDQSSCHKNNRRIQNYQFFNPSCRWLVLFWLRGKKKGTLCVFDWECWESYRRVYYFFVIKIIKIQGNDFGPPFWSPPSVSVTVSSQPHFRFPTHSGKKKLILIFFVIKGCGRVFNKKN